MANLDTQRFGYDEPPERRTERTETTVRRTDSTRQRPRGEGRTLVYARFAAVVLCLVSLPVVAGAEDRQERAASLFDEAGREFARGSYRRAAELFEEAYSIAPHPATLANAAEARVKAGDTRRGAQLYLRLADDPKEREGARAALAALEPMLGRVLVTPLEATDAVVDDVPVEAGTTIWVEPGAHVVRGRVKGRLARSEIHVAAGQLARVTLYGAVEDQGPSSMRVLPKVVTYVLGGATIVSAGFTTWSGLDVLGQKRAFDASYSDRGLDDGLASQTRTNTLLGVTIGLAVLTGVAALFTSWSPLQASSRMDEVDHHRRVSGAAGGTRPYRRW